MKNLELAKVRQSDPSDKLVHLNPSSTGRLSETTENLELAGSSGISVGREGEEIEEMETEPGIILCSPKMDDIRARFKPSQGLPPRSSQTQTDKKEHTSEVIKACRWDEALLPPSKTTGLKQMSLDESLAELHVQYLKQKELPEKSKPPTFYEPGNPENLSVLSKRIHDLSDDEIEDFVGEDNITEESEAEMN